MLEKLNVNSSKPNTTVQCNSIFKKLKLKLECDEDSIIYTKQKIDYTSDILYSYNAYAKYIYGKFSILNASTGDYRDSTEKIKRLFNKKYIGLLINNYKYKMMSDFYNSLSLSTCKYEVIYKIIILTLQSIIGDKVIVCEELDRALMIAVMQDLQNPPSLRFCKELMRVHELAAVFYNLNDDSAILYNYKKYNNIVHIYFDFVSVDCVLLKHVQYKA